jgi:predicted RNA binding protein YcfA (HicA-like mRNA interferase family)
MGQRGSHVKFGKVEPSGINTAIVPKHSEIAVGTIRSIIRQAGISIDQWELL